MVNTLYLVLGGVLLYWFAVAWLDRRGVLPSFIGTQGPILTVHTKRFRELLDRTAGPKRAWRAWGNFGLGITLVVMTGTFLFFLFAAYTTLREPGVPSAVNQPRNYLAIPGVNEFLPLSVAPEIVLGLVIGLVVHEGGHGIMSRVGDIDVESVGLVLIAILPIGAFVEPDDDSRRRAGRGDQARMFAAGVTNNFAIAVVAYVLLFWPVIGSIGVADGALVYGSFADSPAAAAGIDRGDRILSVNGIAIGNNTALDEALVGIDERTVAVTVNEGGGTRTATVERSLFVTGVTDGTPFARTVEPNTRIVAVNGTAVHTEQGLVDAVGDRRVATLGVLVPVASDRYSANVSGPIGAAVRFIENGPAAKAGIPAPRTAVITAVDGERITSATALNRVLDGTRPGQTVRLEYYAGGTRRTHEVELGRDPRDGSGFLGVQVAPGISGLTVSDFGTRLYPADRYLAVLDGSRGGSFVGRIVTALGLPLASLGGAVLPFNFAGFTGGVSNFFVPGGPLSFLGGGLFVLANVLFWTGWINLNLGLFNCIPAFPLDGGHLLRMSAEAVVSRLPVTDRRELTTLVTTSVGLMMLASLVLVLFGPQLLAGTG